MPIKKPELLAPAGNLEKLKTAVLYGADAVYCGGGDYSLRAQAGNFTLSEMAEGVKFAHTNGAKVYAAVNIYAQNKHLVNLPAYLQELADVGIDGFIVADPGIFSLAQKYTPHLPLHISTQANTQNTEAVAFWQRAGASRVVLGREASLADITSICQENTLDIEVFVHGAMCMAYSGRCLLSAYMTGRSANLGDCTQPCRWHYALEEEKRPGEYFPIEEDSHGAYILNSKDLCLLTYLPQLIAAGVASLKIEGRMKSSYYVACVTRVYRAAIDAYLANPAGYTVQDEWVSELQKISHRRYTTGFIGDEKERERQYYPTSSYVRGYDFSGLVLGAENGKLIVEQRNHLAIGDTVELLSPRGEIKEWVIEQMWDENRVPITAAPHARQKISIATEILCPPGTILRRPVREDVKNGNG